MSKLNLHIYGRLVVVDSSGNEIVQFDDPAVDRNYLLVVHGVITVCTCSLGFLANFLLISIILVNSNSLSNFRGIVLFAAVLDTFYCSITFLSMPVGSVTFVFASKQSNVIGAQVLDQKYR
ncbi:hypothetical protein M3Y96_01254400 [Aphelenchoides besseyi]|nr:hypothetical protein M3Y96_01254400 [Aphelenchoides besseyi]